MDLQKLIIALGIALVVVGLLWPVLGKLGLGRLPGDILVKRDGFSFYLPITTSVIVSVVISLLVWLLRK